MEGGGLVHFVDEAHGHQHQAGADVGGRVQQEVQLGEFDGDFAFLLGAFAGAGVLEFDFVVEDDAVGEFVAQVHHQAFGVDGVFFGAFVAGLVGVYRFAVAADGQAFVDAVYAGGGGAEAVLALVLLGLGDHQRRFQLFHFGGEDVGFALGVVAAACRSSFLLQYLGLCAQLLQLLALDIGEFGFFLERFDFFLLLLNDRPHLIQGGRWRGGGIQRRHRTGRRYACQ